MRRLARQLPRGQCLTVRPRRQNQRQLHLSASVQSASITSNHDAAPPAAGAAGAPGEPGAPGPVRTATAPKAIIDVKHIRQNPTVHEQNCLDRNYKVQATYPARINVLFDEWLARGREGRHMRERANLLRRELANPSAARDESEEDAENAESQSLRSLSRDQLIEEARQIKERLSVIEDSEDELTAEMDRLATALPNITSPASPQGAEPLVLSYINDPPSGFGSSESDRVWRSHVHIGSELGLMDFAAAGRASGWGWYYLLNEGAELEQALVQYALAVTTRHGWGQVSPPSVVYSHIADACGFRPRDQNGETQIYTLSRSAADAERGRPELCLAGTAEIPLAGMKADAQLEESELPLRRVAASRCYRAEAGARGVDTKGLYRVHEFTKVEMFAWAAPGESEASELFDEMLDIQTEILGSLGLHCRVLEMPAADLGASAYRKIDIEAFFPSRTSKNAGWGEVTSASVCTDYQTRRLATRVRIDGKMVYPWTLNGTALAVPRVLAAILENGWDEAGMAVTIPEVLRPWMGGKEKIGLAGKHHRGK